MANTTFKVVGISTFKGQRKVRFAQDLKRIIALDKCGNTDIEMFELPQAMTKDAALKYALDNDLFTVDTAVTKMHQINTGRSYTQTVEDIKQRQKAKHSVTAEELVALAQ
jgi:hypothetical protein